MFNELQLVAMVIIAVVVFTLVYFFIAKRKSVPQTPSIQSEKNEIHEVAVQEKVNTVTELPKETAVFEEKPNAQTSRRKGDTILQKRVVENIGPITKQSFTEFAGERILVAEDNPINQKVLLGLLGGSGIEIVLADDGQEALEILEKDTNFVMILMDAHMPRIDGFQATRIIRANPDYDHIVVVALSGDIASDDIQKMKDAGMSEHLAKPLRLDSLYKIIYAYTGKEAPKEQLSKTDKTKSLDISKGLLTCGGDESFYREILSEFMSDYGNSTDKLGNFLRAHDIHAADALLLDIIGVAENIGAHPLGEIASNMKQALGDVNEQSYFTLFDKYKEHSERLFWEIRQYLSS